MNRKSRRLAREVFHGMNVYRGKLQHKQAFLFRLVDVTAELFAMAATVARADAMRRAGHAEAARITELADLFCRTARHKVAKLFRDLWTNDDARKYRVGAAVVDGKHSWLHDGTISYRDLHVVLEIPAEPPARASEAHAKSPVAAG